MVVRTGTLVNRTSGRSTTENKTDREDGINVKSNAPRELLFLEITNDKTNETM